MYEEAEDRPPSICGGCEQDSTLQSVGNSSRGQDTLCLQGTLSEVRAPSICRGPKHSTGLWALGLHVRPGAPFHPSGSATAPVAQWPHLAYDLVVGIQGVSHAFQPSAWLGTLRYSRSPATLQLLSLRPVDPTWRRSLGPWPPPGTYSLPAAPSLCRFKASALWVPRPSMGHTHLPCQKWLGPHKTSCDYESGDWEREAAATRGVTWGRERTT